MRVDRIGDAGMSLVELLIALSILAIMLTLAVFELDLGQARWVLAAAERERIGREFSVQKALRDVTEGLLPRGGVVDQACPQQLDLKESGVVMTGVGILPGLISRGGPARFSILIEDETLWLAYKICDRRAVGDETKVWELAKGVRAVEAELVSSLDGGNAVYVDGLKTRALEFGQAEKDVSLIYYRISWDDGSDDRLIVGEVRMTKSPLCAPGARKAGCS